MTAKIIDGKKIAQEIREQIKEKVSKLRNKPGLAVILVGNNPASEIYVRNKENACKEVGFHSEKYLLPANTSEKKLTGLINKLNNDNKIHGILVQLPLPGNLDEKKAILAISPEKDVDGMHPLSLGYLLIGENKLVSCTPQGVIRLIESTGEKIEGKHAVVVGRSVMVGKPVSVLLLQKNATVTVCHSKTKNLKDITKQADILVCAVGSPQMIKVDMVKKGAIVIDVGINRTDNGMKGDVDFEKVKEVAGYITPVPGGVGPMTIVMLLENTLKAMENKG